MFSKSRKKIVATVMAALLLFLIVTLGVIYGSSYYELNKQNTEMLQRYADSYLPDQQAEERGEPAQPPENPGRPPRPDEPAFRLSTFYSVSFSENGQVLAVDNEKDDIYSESDLVGIAEKVLKEGQPSGQTDALLYRVVRREGYTLVAFMDNTVTDNSMQTLLRYTLIAGGIAIVVLFFLSVLLARRIVRPLEENDRRQKQFVSDAGHELKTPVAVIATNTELLSRQIGENEWLSNIRYENERMGALVTQLLDLSRAENAEIPTGPVDLSRLITGELLPFESVAFEKGFVIQSDIAENIHVEGNETQLRQLAAILLDNAIRHADGGNEIGLTLQKEHRFAVLTVINSAKEIPQEQLTHLFERFYRVDEVRNSEDKHYGLGLAIAKAIVDTHKGSIGAACKDGKVYFTVSLPMQK